ncbi:MAG: LptF/LptG family permease [Solirubrobacterales bacterium]
MIFTLHRYMFRELLRIFILATIGLTLILSLGMILQPVQKFGVGPQQAVKMLFIFMPVTLTFVLPMAALFASALAYGRFASDNEIDACRASGIGAMTLIYPGLALAVLVAIGNLMLSFHVMPYFVHMAEKSLKADAKQILFRNIQRRGYYSFPGTGYQIYADYADMKNDALYGIVVVQSPKRKGIRKIITSDMTETHMRFDPQQKVNEVQLIVHNCRQMDSGEQAWEGRVDRLPVTMEFGTLLGDSIKFKKIDEMKQIRADLMQFDPIARRAWDVYTQYVTELLAKDVNEVVTAGKSFELRGAAGSVWFTGARCEMRDRAVITLVPPITAEEYGVSGQRRRLECTKAEIQVQQGAVNPKLVLYLDNPRIQETGQLLVQYAIGDLVLPERVARSLGGAPLLEQATADLASKLHRSPSPILVESQAGLFDEIADTLKDIKAEMNSRLVFGIGCVPMILIGIGLGVLQKGGHLLSAFGSSCVPAAVLIISIVSGKQLTTNAGASSVNGIMIMWGGLAFLVLLAAVIYRKLQRG